MYLVYCFSNNRWKYITRVSNYASFISLSHNSPSDLFIIDKRLKDFLETLNK